jgi:hypothetical protein
MTNIAFMVLALHFWPFIGVKLLPMHLPNKFPCPYPSIVYLSLRFNNLL